MLQIDLSYSLRKISSSEEQILFESLKETERRGKLSECQELLLKILEKAEEEVVRDDVVDDGLRQAVRVSLSPEDIVPK